MSCNNDGAYMHIDIDSNYFRKFIISYLGLTFETFWTRMAISRSYLYRIFKSNRMNLKFLFEFKRKFYVPKVDLAKIVITKGVYTCFDIIPNPTDIKKFASMIGDAKELLAKGLSDAKVTEILKEKYEHIIRAAAASMGYDNFDEFADKYKDKKQSPITLEEMFAETDKEIAESENTESEDILMVPLDEDVIELIVRLASDKGYLRLTTDQISYYVRAFVAGRDSIK